MTSGFVTIIVTLALAFVVFLIGREISCWYFKINEHLELQRSILSELKAMNRYFDADG